MYIIMCVFVCVCVCVFSVSQIMQLCTAAEELEQVMEVVVRDWTVRLANESKQYYVARPSHRQQPHTGNDA